MTRKTVGLGVMLALLTLASGCRVATLGLTESSVSSQDGLGLRFDLAGRIVACTVDGKELPAGLARSILPGGFYLREAGQTIEVDILGAARKTDDGMSFTASPAGLEMSADIKDKGEYLEISGKVSNPSGKDRGVTIGLCLPVDAAGWIFGRSILEGEPITESKSPELLAMTGRLLTLPITVPATVLGLAKTQAGQAGQAGEEAPTTYTEWTCADSDWDGRQINHGMITPIYSEHAGLALGAVSDHPEIFRVSYKLGRGFNIEADLGLSPLPQKYPNSATFKFIFYRFDPKLHYRGALAKYYDMFPEDFRVRSGKFGNQVEFMGCPEMAAKHAVVFDQNPTTYPEKDEPPSWYSLEPTKVFNFPCPIFSGTPDRPVPSINVHRRAIDLYLSSAAWRSELASARNSVTWGPDGMIQVWNVEVPLQQPRNAILPANPDPKLDLPNLAYWGTSPGGGMGEFDRFTGPSVGNGGTLAGMFFDRWSDRAGRHLENYRPSHLQVVDYPLTFSYHTWQPVQFHAFMWQELTRALAEFLHSQSFLLFAADEPWRMSVMFDQELIDIHAPASEGRPVRDIPAMAHFRSLVGGKPISGAGIGQAVDDPTKEYSPRELAQLERDLNILAVYGWFPGGFGPKALWQKYCLPMQEMAAAGWQPITGAVLAHPDLIVERWGGPESPKVFFTVHNRSEVPVTYELAILLADLKIDPKTVAVVERFTGKSPEAATLENSLVLRSTVAGRGTNLFELSRTGGSIPANGKLKLALSPAKSTIKPPPPFDPKLSASPQFKATMARLNLQPKTALLFLTAYRQEKQELAAAIAFHLAHEGVRDNLDGVATELANWLAPRFASIYEAVLPAPTLTDWTAMRAYYQDPKVWKLAARARLVGGNYEVEVVDPLLETN